MELHSGSSNYYYASRSTRKPVTFSETYYKNGSLAIFKVFNIIFQTDTYIIIMPIVAYSNARRPNKVGHRLLEYMPDQIKLCQVCPVFVRLFNFDQQRRTIKVQFVRMRSR